ncbi:unnamed protein product [Anisakis simplex]|uniref:Sodium/hydrogen exchanger n=1 Tax=Anisakis simplex TaxID=6269 RepID=A0A0M3K763_ANISI|nr:unnamed protein product [Anisakis simplex]
MASMEGEHKPKRYEMASFNWEEVSMPMTISIWLFVAAVAKLLFHIWPQVSEMFPDSSLLIMVGLVIGIALNLIHVHKTDFSLNSQVFFLYLLPPLMFDAGYSMPAREFFDNLGSILTFAIIGTTFNFVAIGVSLWAVGQTGLFDLEMPFLHYLLFGSLIADVDPVAVIVYYRSLLAFTEIGAENIITRDYVYGVLSFFIVGFGGIILGLLWAFAASFMTKPWEIFQFACKSGRKNATNIWGMACLMKKPNVRPTRNVFRYTTNATIVNPVLVLLCPYLAYLMCELFGLSSILGIAFCGCAMKQYIKENVPEKSMTAINYFAKVLSLASETLIFVFLGLSTVSSDHHWNSPFIILTVVFCIVYRTLGKHLKAIQSSSVKPFPPLPGVAVMCYFLNKGRLRKYTKVEQFIMSYGGLRGAIAYGLVAALPDHLPGKRMFVTSCIIIIYWTVFLQGLTLRPIATFLAVERKDVSEKNMTEYIYQNLIDYTMSGMEDIAGMTGHHTVRNWYNKFNRRFLKPWLLKRGARKKMDNSNIVRAYKRIRKREAEDLLKGADLTQNQLFVEALLRHVRNRAHLSRADSRSRGNTVSSLPNESAIREHDSMDGSLFIENPAYLLVNELSEVGAVDIPDPEYDPVDSTQSDLPSSSLNNREVYVKIDKIS